MTTPETFKLKERDLESKGLLGPCLFDLLVIKSGSNSQEWLGVMFYD
jgi:hypothetical protein